MDELGLDINAALSWFTDRVDSLMSWCVSAHSAPTSGKTNFKKPFAEPISQMKS